MILNLAAERNFKLDLSSGKGRKGFCFVAGTLVHTKEGLRPIEEIKVGDYVLSKPESGTGELAYKRVANTFVHENREVFGVTYEVMGKETLLVTTAEHPFWIPTLRVKDPNVKFGGINIPHGKWVTAGEMFRVNDDYYKGKGEGARHYLSTYDNREYGVVQSTPICTATNNPKNNVYGFAATDYGVLWPLSKDIQREDYGEGLTLAVVYQ